jgi:NOL1/NOP2/sun family putative RNA methylase
MIPQRLAERLNEMGQDPQEIYFTKTRKAGLAGSEPVPWMKGFFFLDRNELKETDYGKSSWVQDAASFAPVIALEPRPCEKILDMAAAPGMKTVLIGKLMNNKGSIDACEIEPKRMMRLRKNLSNFGCSICNTIICDASRYKTQDIVDRVLLDAPCSGEGMVTKQKKLFKVWSEKRISKLQKIQKKLIKRGFELLKPGGILVYSTCTFGPEENEAVVEWLIENHKAVPEKVEIPNLKYSVGIHIWHGNVFKHSDKFLRIWPYQNNTNGMFVAKLRKL